jgi:hypothetical protein
MRDKYQKAMDQIGRYELACTTLQCSSGTLDDMIRNIEPLNIKPNKVLTSVSNKIKNGLNNIGFQHLIAEYRQEVELYAKWSVFSPIAKYLSNVRK